MFKRSFFARYGGAMLLLMLHFFIRTHNILAQDPYIDEGFHTVRAARVWHFEENPGRFAHGKVLVYFWLGLFQGEPQTALASSRFGEAIWSLISAASIFLVGRLLFGRRAALLALALYAVQPMAFFWERLGMADPFASGFVALAFWRSLAYARRPSWREGAVLGVLLAFTTLAKLTMGLVPLMPAFAALIYYRWQWNTTLPRQFWTWMRLYVPPLVLAALIVIGFWLPMAIPAYFAENTDRPFILVNDYNLRANADEEQDLLSPGQYMLNVLPLVANFPGLPLLIFGGVSALMLLTYGGVYAWLAQRPQSAERDAHLEAPIPIPKLHRFAPDTSDVFTFARPNPSGTWGTPLRNVLFLLVWVLLVTGLILLAARLVTSRYFMPLAAPMSLGLAGMIGLLWQGRAASRPAALVLTFVLIGLGVAFPDGSSNRWLIVIGGCFGAAALLNLWSPYAGRQLMQALIGLLLGIWLVFHALPFMYFNLNDPFALPLYSTNYTEYEAGYLSGDYSIRDASAYLNQLVAPLPQPPQIYAIWNTCHLMYFYSEAPITCLNIDRPRSDLIQQLTEDLPVCQPAYLVIRHYRRFFDGASGFHWEALAEFPTFRIDRPTSVWRVWHGDNCPQNNSN